MAQGVPETREVLGELLASRWMDRALYGDGLATNGLRCRIRTPGFEHDGELAEVRGNSGMPITVEDARHPAGSDVPNDPPGADALSLDLPALERGPHVGDDACGTRYRRIEEVSRSGVATQERPTSCRSTASSPHNCSSSTGHSAGSLSSTRSSTRSTSCQRSMFMAE
jgi:hypothetical protein